MPMEQEVLQSRLAFQHYRFARHLEKARSLGVDDDAAEDNPIVQTVTLVERLFIKMSEELENEGPSSSTPNIEEASKKKGPGNWMKTLRMKPSSLALDEKVQKVKWVAGGHSKFEHFVENVEILNDELLEQLNDLEKDIALASKEPSEGSEERIGANTTAIDELDKKVEALDLRSARTTKVDELEKQITEMKGKMEEMKQEFNENWKGILETLDSLQKKQPEEISEEDSEAYLLFSMSANTYTLCTLFLISMFRKLALDSFDLHLIQKSSAFLKKPSPAVVIASSAMIS